MNHALAMHDAFMRAAVNACGGYEVNTEGEPCWLRLWSVLGSSQASMWPQHHYIHMHTCFLLHAQVMLSCCPSTRQWMQRAGAAWFRSG